MSGQLPASPYKGLAPFGDTEVDSMFFFGRERDVEIVCANVVAARLTVLYGPSGVGKSSLLAAAVARRLRELPERPAVVVSSAWAQRPIETVARAVCAEAAVATTDSLAEAVGRASTARGEVYLLLDQAEEYFVYHPEKGPFEDELAGLLRGGARVNVLLSLREEALAKLDRFKAAIPGILDNYLRLDRLSQEAGRAAIEQPLGRWRELGGAAVAIEPALTERVLDEVAAGRIGVGVGGAGEVVGGRGDERIEAPYLQLVLERVWEVEQEHGSALLRLATLEELGGAAQIVAVHLQRAMEALTPAEQDIASALLRQLVTPSGAKIAHAVPDLAGYAGVGENEARAVLDVLAARRILRPGDDGRYEIYHDVLAAPILAWRARYVQSQALVEAHRRNRRLALLAFAALAAMVVTALVAVFALVQRSNAREDARAAHARELDASAVSLLPIDPELGLLLARESAVMSPTATAEDVLRQALTNSRLRRVVAVGRPLLAAANVRSDIVAAADDGSVVIAGRRSRQVVRTGHSARGASIAANGVVLVTGRDGRLRLVAGRRVELVPGVADAVGADISNRGDVAVVRFEGKHGFPSSKVRLVSLLSGKVLLQVDHGSPVTAAAVSSGSRLLATGGGVDHVVRLWRVPSGLPLRELRGHIGAITSIAFSTRGTLIATAATDGIGRVWRLSNGSPVSVLSGHTNYITDIAFSPDGTQVATASLDRTARTWKAGTGAALAICLGGGEAVSSAAFSRTGHEITTASLDGSARVFDTVVQPELPVVAQLGAPVTYVAFRPDGEALEATSDGRSYRVRLPNGPAVETGPSAPVARVVTGPAGLRARIDGKTVTITSPDGTTVALVGHKAKVTSVSFSADGTRVVTASADHDGKIWDAHTGGLLQTLRGHFAVVSDARFSPDGRWVVTAGPGTAGLWNASNGRLVYYLRGHSGKLLSVAFDPAGRRIATGGEDGTVRAWRCTICGGIDELVALASHRLARTGRDPTPAERARYGL